VFLAHLILSNQPPATRRLWREAYDAPAGFDNLLMLQLAGVEIMRRLIGYAQLPVRGLKPKCDLLELSRTLVLRPELHLMEVA
jgi:5-methylthioribose kinase